MLTNHHPLHFGFSILHCRRCFAAMLCYFWMLMVPCTSWGTDRIAPANTLIIGGDHNFPPYEFLDKDGKPAGYNVELTKAIADVMGMKVEIVLGPWDVMLKELKEGRIDALQGVSFFKGRALNLDYSPAHAIIHQSIFARRGEQSVESLAELRNKEVIVQRRGSMHDFLIEKDIKATLILTSTHADALRLLASGQHDYALVANLPGLALGKELGLSNIVRVAKPVDARRYGYAVKKGNDDLLAELSEGLAIVKNTGRQQSIYDKWLGSLENEGLSWKKLGLVGAFFSGALLLTLAAIMIWNRQLHRKVESRTKELQLHQKKLIHADKMSSLGVLVSGVAHEINNPNGLLLLNLPVLQEAFDDVHDILEAHYKQHGDFKYGGLPYSRMRQEIPLLLADMQEGSKNIKRIVDDLKNFSRQGSTEYSDRVNLNTVVAMAIRLVDNSIRNATNRFQLSYADQLPTFKGNAQRIEQIVINLILNACQSLENMDKAISIITVYDSKDDKIILQVCDEGRGIDKANVTRLADPFFTTKRDVGGTGLGLFVSAGIAREHGATLEFDSVLGQGTIATLTLPRLLAGEPYL